MLAAHGTRLSRSVEKRFHSTAPRALRLAPIVTAEILLYLEDVSAPLRAHRARPRPKDGPKLTRRRQEPTLTPATAQTYDRNKRPTPRFETPDILGTLVDPDGRVAEKARDLYIIACRTKLVSDMRFAMSWNPEPSHR